MAPWFRPRAPSTDLRAVLACRYDATVAGRHDLIPDGCVDLLAIGTDRVVVCGPDTHAWSFALPAGVAVAGVRFRPGAAASVLRTDAEQLVDRRVDAADLLGDAPARRLLDRLAAAGRTRARVGVLEQLVRELAGDRDHDPDGTVALAAIVADRRGCPVDELAVFSGVSSRQLRRRFDRAVGYGPAYYARIARLQRFATVAAHHPRRRLADLAADAGYADQPHLAKDCRDVAGVTPRQLVDLLPRSSVDAELGDVRSVQDGRRRAEARSAA